MNIRNNAGLFNSGAWPLYYMVSDKAMSEVVLTIQNYSFVSGFIENNVHQILYKYMIKQFDSKNGHLKTKWQMNDKTNNDIIQKWLRIHEHV